MGGGRAVQKTPSLSDDPPMCFCWYPSSGSSRPDARILSPSPARLCLSPRGPCALQGPCSPKLRHVALPVGPSRVPCPLSFYWSASAVGAPAPLTPDVISKETGYLLSPPESSCSEGCIVTSSSELSGVYKSSSLSSKGCQSHAFYKGCTECLLLKVTCSDGLFDVVSGQPRAQ